jgi:hypothetical protein
VLTRNQNDIHDEKEHIAFGECLLAFSSEYFFFHVLSKKKLNIKVRKTVIIAMSESKLVTKIFGLQSNLFCALDI